ncbi:hypothetical protein R50073_23240 [Maricurvus nonylphenolicus]
MPLDRLAEFREHTPPSFEVSRLWLCIGLGLLLLLPDLALASPPSLPENYITEVIIALLLIQTMLIIGLQRSRVKYKRAKKDLKRSQKELEQRVIERTNKLRNINNQLYDEIAKHEITEELLRETQDYLNSIINSMPSILIGVTRHGTITHWNTAATTATDISAQNALGRSLDDVYPDLPIDSTTINDIIEKGVPQITENHQQGTGSHTRHTDITIYPLLSSEVTGAVIRIDDVSMRVRIENMMIQNEKMMSLGELAAGMAHEINNPLSAILHGIQNIYRRTSPDLPKNHTVAEECGTTVQQIHSYLNDREIFKFIDGIREAGERSARIVTNMLEFSRSNSRRHRDTNIVELLNHSLELAANAFELQTPEGIEPLTIKKEFSKDIPPVSCSAAEIQQVLLNLLRNACQAFSNEDYGPPLHPTITLRAYIQHQEVCIEVEDNGPGMSEAVKRHIFEPFFTTKEVGKGTGLGLSVTYFIVTEHHDGTIEVDSQPGEGTCFIIKLPLSTEVHATQRSVNHLS